MTTELQRRAEQILSRFLPPALGTKRQFYQNYVEQIIRPADFPFEDVELLCRYFECGVADLVDRIVSDKFGKA